MLLRSSLVNLAGITSTVVVSWRISYEILKSQRRIEFKTAQQLNALKLLIAVQPD